MDPKHLEMAAPVTRLPEMIFGYGYVSEDGALFYPLSPFFVSENPFIPNGNQQLPHPQFLPQSPLLPIHPTTCGLEMGSCDCDDKKKDIRLEVSNQNEDRPQHIEDPTNSNASVPPPNITKIKLNPHAREFVGLQTCKTALNAGASEFIPGEKYYMRSPIPVITDEGREAFWNNVETSFDESENDESEEDEGGPRVIIGSENSSLCINTFKNGSNNEDIHSLTRSKAIDSKLNPEADHFVPGYWKTDQFLKNVDEK